MNRKFKLIIYNTILTPIIMNERDYWSLKTITEPKFKQPKCVPSELSIELQEGRIRNKTTRTERKVEPLSSTMEKRSLQWYRHVMRMSDRRYSKKVLLWTLHGRDQLEDLGKNGLKGYDGRWCGEEQHYMMCMQDGMMAGWSRDNS